MKKITFILLSLLGSFGIYAQANQQSLLGNTWFLAKIEVDDQIIFPPFEESSENSSLVFSTTNGNTTFVQNQCINLAQGSFLSLNESTFHISELAVTASVCPNIDLELFFTTLNSEVIWDNMEFDFQYIISQDNNLLQLQIIGANGNKAFYYNNATATSKLFNGQLLKIYPIPSSDFLYLSIVDIDNIKIVDMLGKQIFSKYQSTENETQIDIQHLAKGNYILQISKDNQTENVKFVKK